MWLYLILINLTRGTIMQHIKEVSITIDYQLYNKLLQTFELNNQDDVDACIGSFIEERIDEQLTLDAMREVA